jgi:hypothetical protein
MAQVRLHKTRLKISYQIIRGQARKPDPISFNLNRNLFLLVLFRLITNDVFENEWAFRRRLATE